ncbi:MAG: DUF1853 family protein [Saprospiraceae bacterium]
MNSLQRITSILEAKTLDTAITGVQTFNLAQLSLKEVLDFQLPKKLRLGHLVERIVSELIKSSNKYELLYESLQIQENKKTIGEIDFIIREQNTGQILHLELAYKFYLYDPSISTHAINNWVGPNRNDSLKTKLEKLKSNQFPLLFKEPTKESINELAVNEIDQALCLMASLFIPYQIKGDLSFIYKKNTTGLYMDTATFRGLDHTDGEYYIPSKSEWGMKPSDNDSWIEYDEIQQHINFITKEKQSLLCWRKQNESYSQFFITWW